MYSTPNVASCSSCSSFSSYWQCLALQRENESLKKDIDSLKAENQRVKDAHAAAGMSFTALNQHSSQLQRVNKKLMR